MTTNDNNTINDSVIVNSKYKDKLFCFLFGNENHKENILSLYNALNDTNHNNPEELELTTIGDAIYIKMKNDVSFLIDSNMSLWEQQSSFNPNMPIRGLMYFGNLYSAYIEKKKLNIYGSTLIKLPTPKYIVFYNGTAKKPAKMELKLSDAFINKDTSGNFEWTATMINLNKGNNEILLSKCKVLSDYMFLIEKIRENKASGLCAKESVNKAIDECIAKNVLKDFLSIHKAEVLNMCITEFNEEVFVNSIREEGRTEERIDAFKKMMQKGYSIQTIADIYEIAREEVEALLYEKFE